MTCPTWCLCGVVDDKGDGTCGNCRLRIMTDDDEPRYPPGHPTQAPTTRGDAMTITERITARLDAMEAAARAATPGPWEADTSQRGDCIVWGPGRNDPTGKFILNSEAEPHWTHNRAVAFDCDRADVAHIALNDPAAVLGLVDGLRKVVALHAPSPWGYDCGACGWLTGACPTLAALAAALGVDHTLLAGATCSCGAEHDRRGTGESGDDWHVRHLAALDPVGEGSEGAEAAVEGPRSAATPVRRVPSHDDGCKDARETR